MEYSNLHISLCGQAKHGKSTLAGRLVYELGGISAAQLQRYEDEARSRNRDFNKFSMMFLEHRSATFALGSEWDPDDQSRTVFPARDSIALDDMRLTLIDTPGLERFLDNVIYGIYLADRAVVVVEAPSGVGYGTEVVCRILKAFGIPIMAFCVTKMDIVEYSQSRYEEVYDQILTQIIEPYAPTRDIPIVPVSALEGSGIARTENTQSNLLAWYSGPSLLEVLTHPGDVNRMSQPQDVRFAVEGPKEILSPKGVGTVLIGSLEYGELEEVRTLVVEPASTIRKQTILAHIKSIHLAKGVTANVSANPVSRISARGIVSVAVRNWTREEANEYLRSGGILGAPEHPPTVARVIQAEIVFFEPDTVYQGKEYILHPHVASTVARIRSIVAKDTLYRNLAYDEYRSGAGEVVTAEIEFATPCCVEATPEYMRLSRFVLRAQNAVVACGRCVKIIE